MASRSITVRRELLRNDLRIIYDLLLYVVSTPLGDYPGHAADRQTLEFSLNPGAPLFLNPAYICAILASSSPRW